MSDEIFSMDDVDLDEVCEADKICEDSRILVMDDLVGHKIYLFREKETVDVLPRSLKSYSLALPGAEGGKVKYIPIRVLEAKGNIYVSENIYNANANRFITNLGDAYGRKENEILPPEMPFDSIKKLFDLSLCKTPYRKAYFTKDHKVAFKSIAPSAEDIKDRSRFDSIMANPKIRYIYSSKENSTMINHARVSVIYLISSLSARKNSLKAIHSVRNATVICLLERAAAVILRM